MKEVGIGLGPGEDPDAAGSLGRGVAGLLQSLPAGFQEDALLGIHQPCFQGIVAERGSVEVLHSVQQVGEEVNCAMAVSCPPGSMKCRSLATLVVAS